jgi:hypothetical protein
LARLSLVLKSTPKHLQKKDLRDIHNIQLPAVARCVLLGGIIARSLPSIRNAPMTKSLFAALAAAALLVSFAAPRAQAQTPASGMLLGVYVFENQYGLRVTGTIPGYSAEGRLFPGDVLMQATTDGQTMYSIRTRQEIEWAKDQIGPYTPAAIEVWRPSQGMMYFWVTFQPVDVGPAAAAMARNGAPRQMKAQFQTETEKPGAKAMFQTRKGGNQQVSPPQTQQPKLPAPPQGFPKPGPGVKLPGGIRLDASSLFGK